MDSIINKGRMEFNNENYEKALDYFDGVDEDDEDYNFVLIFKITCLMELERYDKALFIIDSLLAEGDLSEFLFYEKIRCHIALGERDDAMNTLKKFERIISSDNKRMMLDLARFYKILKDYKNSLRFCNRALDVDGEFAEAVIEKSIIGIFLKNEEIADNCADKLLAMKTENESYIVIAFMIKLYFGKFSQCIDIIHDLDENISEMLESVIFNQLCESLDVNIYLNDDVEVSLGDAIDLLLDYEKNGMNYGSIGDVEYVIM